LGATQSPRSNNSDSSVIHSVVASVIQKLIARVGALMRVRRISCVPMAQVAAATSIIATPSGLPESVVTSCQSSSTTPSAAAATPTQARGINR
jgi:hypothetical protein